MSISRLDNEFPMILKAQEQWLRDPNEAARLEVTSDVPMKDYIDLAKLQGLLDRWAELAWEGGHLDFLGTQDGVDAGFVNYLKTQEMPHPAVKSKDDMVMVQVSGSMSDLPMWEVPISNFLHDLYFKGSIDTENVDGQAVVDEGVRRFQVKGDYLRGGNVRFVEAGTRWRYSFGWYGLVFTLIMGDLPNQIAGTTNPYTSLAYGMRVVSYDTPEVVKLVRPSVSDVITTKGRPIVVSGCNAYEIGHLSAHFGTKLNYEWGSDLTCDVGAYGRPLPLTWQYVK